MPATSGITSDLSVTAEIRLKKENLQSDIAAVRAEIQSGLSGLNIDLGVKLADSVAAAAPGITQAVSAAVAAGGAKGALAVQAAMQTALANANAAAATATPLGPVYGPQNNPNAGGSGSDSGIGGLGSLNRLMTAMFAIRAARAAEEYYVKTTDIAEKEFEADNMPERTDSQRISKARAQVASYTQERDEKTGFFGWLTSFNSLGGNDYYANQSEMNNKISNAKTDLSNAEANKEQHDVKNTLRDLADRAEDNGLSGFAKQRAEVNQKFTSESESVRDKLTEEGATDKIGQAEDDLKKARDESLASIKRMEDQYHRVNALQDDYTRALELGNKHEAERLELLKKIAETQFGMNQKEAGSGDAWAGTMGAAMVQNQQRRSWYGDIVENQASATTKRQIDSESDEMDLRSRGENRAAEAEKFDANQKSNLERKLQALETETIKHGRTPASGLQVFADQADPTIPAAGMEDAVAKLAAGKGSTDEKNAAQAYQSAVTNAAKDKASFARDQKRKDDEEATQLDAQINIDKLRNSGNTDAAEKAQYEEGWRRRIKQAEENDDPNVQKMRDAEKSGEPRGHGPEFVNPMQAWMRMQHSAMQAQTKAADAHAEAVKPWLQHGSNIGYGSGKNAAAGLKEHAHQMELAHVAAVNRAHNLSGDPHKVDPHAIDRVNDAQQRAANHLLNAASKIDGAFGKTLKGVIVQAG